MSLERKKRTFFAADISCPIPNKPKKGKKPNQEAIVPYQAQELRTETKNPPTPRNQNPRLRSSIQILDSPKSSYGTTQPASEPPHELQFPDIIPYSPESRAKSDKKSPLSSLLSPLLLDSTPSSQCHRERKRKRREPSKYKTSDSQGKELGEGREEKGRWILGALGFCCI